MCRPTLCPLSPLAALYSPLCGAGDGCWRCSQSSIPLNLCLQRWFRSMCVSSEDGSCMQACAWPQHPSSHIAASRRWDRVVMLLMESWQKSTNSIRKTLEEKGRLCKMILSAHISYHRCCLGGVFVVCGGPLVLLPSSWLRDAGKAEELAHLL